MEKHITLVAALNIGFGALGVFIAIIVLVAVVGGGLISGDSEAIFITSIVGPAISIFLLILSIPEIIAGIAILKRKSWGRILGLIIAVLDLFNIPIGTAIGIYTLWVLLQDEVVQLFSAEADSRIKTA